MLFNSASSVFYFKYLLTRVMTVFTVVLKIPMLHKAQLCHGKLSVHLTVCLSVRLSVALRYPDHTGWNTSGIISRPISLRFWLGIALAPTSEILLNGNRSWGG